jgi:hypothetical protein
VFGLLSRLPVGAPPVLARQALFSVLCVQLLVRDVLFEPD